MTHLLADTPRIADFNVSHSGDLALLAWSHRRATGIDIERRCTDTNLRNLFPIVLGDGDLREIEQRGSGHERELFYNIWVAKEALLKASGLGITVGLERFSVASRRRREVVVSGDREIAAALVMFRAAWIGMIAGYSVSIAWAVDVAARRSVDHPRQFKDNPRFCPKGEKKQ